MYIGMHNMYTALRNSNMLSATDLCVCDGQVGLVGQQDIHNADITLFSCHMQWRGSPLELV